MDAQTWDQRYAASELVWSAEPNRWVRERCADLPVGRALDVAAGEGRNALWLARLGWQVTALDFSSVALDKGRQLETEQPPDARPVDWQVADATSDPLPAGPFDLVVLAYFQLPAEQRRAVHRAAAQVLAPNGILLVVAHDSSNIAEGTGGPQDPTVLLTAQDVVADLAGIGELSVREASVVLRTIDGADRPARDALAMIARD